VKTESIDRLALVLSQSVRRYEELLALLQHEKEAAIDSDASQLSDVVEQKTELMAVLAALEKKRSRLLQSLAGSLGIPQHGLTLSALSLSLPADESLRINRLSASLRSLAAKVQRANDENRQLVLHCLDLVRSALGFFQQMLHPASVYGASGQVRSGTGGGRLLSGII
jgi:flagellar biosynthesis/type III secretory pathway chaperone